jgi:small-conductance mechanosensitive channel
LWKFPFEPGGFVECGEIRGKVISTELRLTTIRSTTGELIVVPNAFLVGNPLEVLTDRDLRRVEITTGVAYGEDVEEGIIALKSALAKAGMKIPFPYRTMTSADRIDGEKFIVNREDPHFATVNNAMKGLRNAPFLDFFQTP